MIAPRRLSAPLFWLPLALALLTRTVLPGGWMPVAQADGIVVVLCTGDGPTELVLGRDGQYHKRTPAPSTPPDPCPFGLAGAQSADLPPVLALITVRPAVALSAPPRSRSTRLIAPHSLRPPVRGPPMLA